MRFNGWNTSSQWINNRLSIAGVSVSHFSRKVGNLARAKYENGIDWTQRITAAKWRNRGGGRGETKSSADAEHGVTPPSGPLRGGFAGGYAEAEEVAAAAEKVLRRQRKLLGRKNAANGGGGF